MKILKTKIYKVTYAKTNGFDHFSGRYILENDWLLKMIENDLAKIERK